MLLFTTLACHRCQLGMQYKTKYMEYSYSLILTKLSGVHDPRKSEEIRQYQCELGYVKK
jgi:hypothetical protein